MRKVAVAALAACLAASPAMAQSTPQKVPFATRLERSRTTLQVENGDLRGPGAAILTEAVARARYVLLGEDHLSREIPQFTIAICRLMAPGGLDALAVEIGPEAARVVNDDVRRPDRSARIARFLRAHPDAFAFQNGQDESDMAARCAQAAGPDFRIWGLDQEFLGASGYLLEQILDAHPGPAARSAIRNLAAIDRAATTAALASGSPGDLLMFTVTDRQMADAGAAIARDGGYRARHLFNALVETRAIYLGQNGDSAASNGRRARLMKRTLMQYLAARAKPARILFKFGDVHMAKGVNALRQRDVGNFVAERAEGEGVGSLHIAVYGVKGVHALYAGVARQVRHEPFVMSDDADYVWLKDALLARDAAGADRDWMLIDLRPLRAHVPLDMSQQWRDTVQRYDLVVVAPELTPSSLLGAR
ncbi:hypothetical protein BH10PSE14_BH10PSE14_21500 [soil metagenome]